MYRLVSIYIFILPTLVVASPVCNNSFLNSFSSEKYEYIVNKYTSSEFDNHDPVVQLGLVAIYKWGIGTESNEDAVNKLLYDLGKNEIAKIVQYWDECSTMGNIAAKILLGIVYYDGLGVDHDLGLAKKYFEGINYTIAKLGLAAIYHRQGKGEFATPIIEEAINVSQDINEFRIAELYYHGIIFDKNYSFAIRWYRKSAERGNYNALGILGYMYTVGLGVDKDQDIARYWFDKQSAHPNFKTENNKPIISDIY